MTASRNAPAKINVTLEILGARDDGYHNLRSVMLPIAWYDRLAWEPAAANGFDCDDAAIAAGNLVERAFLGLAAERTMHLTLEKRIPYGAGLGGGSSDAASVILAALDGAFGEVALDDPLAYARALGSDVPFFLCKTGALVEATGERVTALGALPDWWVVVALPGVHVATADAYRALDASRAGGRETRPRAGSVSLAMVEAIQRRDFPACTALTQNDFEPVVAAAHPRIGETLGALREAGARVALLSGSGSACIALCEDEAAAQTIARRVRDGGTDARAVALHHDESWRG